MSDCRHAKGLVMFGYCGLIIVGAKYFPKSSFGWVFGMPLYQSFCFF